MQQFSLAEIIQFYLKKFEDGSKFMAVRSLVYFEDAGQDEDVILLKEKVKWNSVKKTISDEVRKHYR